MNRLRLNIPAHCVAGFRQQARISLERQIDFAVKLQRLAIEGDELAAWGISAAVDEACELRELLVQLGDAGNNGLRIEARLDVLRVVVLEGLESDRNEWWQRLATGLSR
jgi:hypothetical protein